MRFAADLHGARARLRRGALWAALGWASLTGGFDEARAAQVPPARELSGPPVTPPLREMEGAPHGAPSDAPGHAVREIGRGPTREDPGEPPFDAVVGTSPAEVRADGAHVHIAGALRPGARVRISGCEPDCVHPGSWLDLEEGGRVLRRAVTVPAPEVPTAGAAVSGGIATDRSDASMSEASHAAAAPITWARVVAPDVEVLASTASDAEVLRSTVEGSSLALIGDPALERAGWRARRAGGVVPSGQVEDYRPPDFSGAVDPQGPQAFVLTPTVLARPQGGDALPDLTVVPAFGHVAVLGDPDQAQLEVEGGTLAREEVRLATRHARPSGVPAGARWVHVDREENVLTAYEGDRWVYAALVSVGTPGTVKASDPGLFRVYAKHRHADMKWVGEYDVEAVPDVLFYNRGEALHGAFWHDDFGHAVSYGCINLSLADARWLFAWAPPDLPETWDARNPAPGEDSLWVWVE